MNKKELLLNQQNKALAANLKAEQEQVKRNKQSMTHRSSQYSHELKRKDQEYERLKERLGQASIMLFNDWFSFLDPLGSS